MKTILIGLDGATFDIINPLIQKGYLPNLKRLISNGASGTLMSTIPPCTPPAWTSIITGKAPGKHGIFGFLDANDQPVNSTNRKSEPIWRIANKKKLKTLVINVPITYPPKEDDNNTILCYSFVPDEKCDFVHPKFLKNVIMKEYNLFDLKKQSSIKDYILKYVILLRELTLWLMKKFEWDFLMVVFMSTDIVMHHFFDQPELILKTYKEVDDSIGVLLNNLKNDNYVIFVVSDHGSKVYDEVFLLNSFLNAIESKQKRIQNNIPSKLIARSILLLLCHIGYEKNRKLFQTLAPLLKKISPLFSNKQLRKTFYWKPENETYVYAPLRFRSIRNNKLNKKNYDKIMTQVIKELYETEAVKKIYSREEVYWGPETIKAPELVVELKENTCVAPIYAFMNLFTDGFILKTKVPGHAKDGIFIAYGDGIRRNFRIEHTINTWDIAPTILYLLGLPIPIEMDGKVITAIFEEKTESIKRKIRSETSTKPIKKSYKWTREEKKKIIERLKELGYV